MRTVGIVLVVIALLLALILALATLLLPDTASNNAATRAVAHTTVFGLTPQKVQLDLALSQYAQCQQGARPLDVVILIDQSDSMTGEPLTQALAGARAFLDTLDLSKHEVALALFSDEVNAYQGLTADRSALEAALAEAAAGSGTNIAKALETANNELQGVRRRFGSAAFVVLFTDGGTESTTIPAVENLAKTARDAGIELFVIGLRGDDYNEPLLRSVASGPDYLRLAPPVEEIPVAFRSIAEQINQVIATDLRVIESVAPGLTVDPATVTPPADVTAEQIVWQVPALNKAEMVGWASLTYRVAPTGYGFRQLAPQETRMALVDCSNQVVTALLPMGPRLLFLPPVPLLLLLLPLLLIPGLLLIAFGGRTPKPGSAVQRSAPVPPAATGASPAPELAPSAMEGILFMDWLGKVESLSPETGRTPNAPVRTLPTLIIGLGASGRVVLHKIAADLQDRWGPTLPERVRLLQVNVPLGNPAPVDILPNLLEVNLTRSGEQLNKSGAHMEWARDVSTRTGRPAGRMALFADLAIGKSESQLHPALRKVLSGQRQATVWIVADAFSDDGSSIIADLAHLVRTLALPEEISSVRLCMAMHNARWSDRLGPQQRSARAFATLRELQRLRQKRKTVFAYAPGYGQRELEATSDGRLFDEVYLFDGKGEQMDEASYDVSALPAGEGVLEVIAAGMTAFLDPALSQRFLEWEKNAQTEVARTGSARLEDYVSAMGCCTVSVPVEEIRRLAELRLAHRALFDLEDGLFGWERLERNGELVQRKQVRIDISAGDLAAFRQATGLATGAASPYAAGQARTKVRAYLDQMMNDGEPLRLRWASALLEQVTASQPDLSTILDPFQRELNDWIKLVGQVSPPAATPSQHPASDIGFGFNFDFGVDLPSFDQDSDSGPAGALYQQWERHWQQAREGFPVFKAQSPHTSVATLADESAIFERYLPRPGQEATRLRRRVYWLWQDRQGYMTLQLLVLPNDLTAKPANERYRTWAEVLRDNPYAYASSPRDANGILEGLLAAARAQSRGINAESITLYLGRQSGSLTQTLKRNSSPLFRRKEIGGAGEGVAATPYRYLLAPASDAGDQLATNLGVTMRFVGSDPATVVLMQVKHILPIANTVAYDEALNAYNPTRNEQVFLAEQIAAEMENAARQEVQEEHEALLLPPDVVALLEQSQESVELLGEAIVYGLLEIHPARGAVTVSASSTEALPLAALGVGRLLLEGAPLLHDDGQWRQRLRTAVDEQREVFAERRYELLNQVRQQAVPPLLVLPPGAGQELGIVLAAAIQRESIHV